MAKIKRKQIDDTFLQLPPDGTYGTTNVAGINEGDSPELAFDKVADILDKLAPALPPSLSTLTLNPTPAFFSAVPADGASTTTGAGQGILSNVFEPSTGSINIRLTTSGTFYDGDDGILSANITDNVGTSNIFPDAPNGGIVLSDLDDTGLYTNLDSFGGTSEAAQVNITTDEDPYLGIAGREGFYKVIGAQLQITDLTNFPASPTTDYAGSLTHSDTGTVSLTFRVEDLLTPTATLDATTPNDNSGKFLSGIRVFDNTDSLTVEGTITNAVNNYFNPTRIGQVRSNGAFAATNFPNTAARTLNETVNFTTIGGDALTITFNNNVYFGPLATLANQSVNVTLRGFNAAGVTADSAPNSLNLHIDSISPDNEFGRVQSGNLRYPTTFGGSYSSSNSLVGANNTDNYAYELQVLNGVIQYPKNQDYSTFTPIGLDYGNIETNVNTGDDTGNGDTAGDRYRYFTVNLGGTGGPVPSVEFNLTGAVGFSLNPNTKIIGNGIRVQVRITGTTPTNGWLDANAAFNTGQPNEDGDAALDVGGTAGTITGGLLNRRVTFGASNDKEGSIFVRVGIPCPTSNNGSGIETFRGIQLG